MPSKKINDLSSQKAQAMADMLAAFEKLITDAAASLSETLIKDFIDKLSSADGELSNGSDNIKKIALIEKVWQSFQQSQGTQIIVTFVQNLTEIMQLNKAYYTALIPAQVQSDAINDLLDQKLGIKRDANGEWTAVKNGYVDALMSDRTTVNEVKKIAFNNIVSKTGPEALKKEIQNYLVGKDDAAGEFYNQYDAFAFDTYSAIDRMSAKLHADRLDLKYFLYNGGVIRDSRQFCIDHHGKCYSTDEAEGWSDLIGQYKLVPGKTKREIKVPIGPIVEDAATYEPIRDLGGIRCRHSADFVSTEIAEQLRKDNPPTLP